MTVHIDRQKHVGWQLDVKNRRSFTFQVEKKGHSAHHNIKDLYCFPDFLYIYIFVQQDASQQVMICSNVCFLSLLDLVGFFLFFLSITAGISGVFALCTKAWWCNKLLIFHSI